MGHALKMGGPTYVGLNRLAAETEKEAINEAAIMKSHRKILW